MSYVDRYSRDIIALTTAAKNKDVTFISDTVNGMTSQWLGELFVCLLAEYSMAIEIVSKHRGQTAEEWLQDYALRVAKADAS